MNGNESNMSEKKPRIKDFQNRFKTNICWQFVANGSQIVFGGSYLLLLGRFLGPTEFGLFSALLAIVSVIGLLFEMRLQEVIARDFCNLHQQCCDGWRSNRLIDLFLLELVGRVIPIVIICFFSRLLLDGIKVDQKYESMLYLASAGFIFSKSGSGVSAGLLRVLSRTDVIAACMAADWFFRLFVSVIFVLVWNLDITSALWIALVFGAVCNIAQISFAYLEFINCCEPIVFKNWSSEGIWSRVTDARRLILSNLGLSASDLMAKDLDVLMIAGVLTADKVGVYKMSKSLVQVMWRAIDPFYMAIMPEIQKLWQLGEFTGLTKLILKTSILLLVYSIGLVVVCNATLIYFGDLLLGGAYADITSVVAVMSIWLFICAPLIWGAPLAVAINHPEYSVIGGFISMAVGVFTFNILTPSLGLLGASISWSATLVSGFIFTAYLATYGAYSIISRK